MTRTVRPDCCVKCQGTGKVARLRVWGAGDGPPYVLAPATPVDVYEFHDCDHTVRTDQTGLTDDEERILELERRLAECAATCEAEARKAREAALEEAANAADRHYHGDHRKTDNPKQLALDIGQAIRALKGERS